MEFTVIFFISSFFYSSRNELFELKSSKEFLQQQHTNQDGRVQQMELQLQSLQEKLGILEKFEVECAHLKDTIERLEKDKLEIKSDQNRSSDKYSVLQKQ